MFLRNVGEITRKKNVFKVKKSHKRPVVVSILQEFLVFSQEDDKITIKMYIENLSDNKCREKREKNNSDGSIAFPPLGR